MGLGPAGAIRHPLNPTALLPDNGRTVRGDEGTRWGRFRPNGRHRGHALRGRPGAVRVGSAPRPENHHRISRVIEMPASADPGPRPLPPRRSAKPPFGTAAESTVSTSNSWPARITTTPRMITVSTSVRRADCANASSCRTSATTATMHCVLNHAIDIIDDTHATGEIYNVTYLRSAAPDGTDNSTPGGAATSTSTSAATSGGRSRTGCACTNGPDATSSTPPCPSTPRSSARAALTGARGPSVGFMTPASFLTEPFLLLV